MITLDRAAATAIDDAVDAALTRITRRAGEFAGGFPALGEAIRRAGSGGKRFRPAIVLASYRACAGDIEPPREVFAAAAAFELLHAAFVVHDDVIDHDTMRRGIPNVGGEFRLRARRAGADAASAAVLGDAAAILAGDLLLHEAERLVALAELDATRRSHLLDLLDDALFVSAAGELADVEHAIASDVADAPAILAAARDKTAVYSFAAPLCAGAVLAGASDDVVDALREAGGELGLAYQLADDLIGTFGSAQQAGRDAGADLREAKRTPIVALARESAQWPYVDAALALAPTGPVAVRDAQRALAATGARDGVRALIDDALATARQAASDPVVPRAARRLVDDLAAAVSERVP